MSTDGPDWQAPPTSQHSYYDRPAYAAPKPPPNRGPLIIGISVFVVIALAVLTTVLIINRNGSTETASPATDSPTSSSSSSSSPSTTGSSASSSTSPEPSSVVSPSTVEQITVQPLTSGWQGVWSYKDGVAYDVPPDWKVETPDDLVGFEDNNGKPIAIIHGVSTYRANACAGVSGSNRGRVGFKTTGDQDPTQAATDIAKLFARGVALKDDGTSAPFTAPVVTDTTVDQGKIAAKYARVTVSLNDKSTCGSPTVLVVAVAFRSLLHKTATFVGFFDQGVTGALDPASLPQIFSTLRPYQR